MLGSLTTFEVFLAACRITGTAEADFPDEITPRPVDCTFFSAGRAPFPGRASPNSCTCIGSGATNRGIDTSVREASNTRLSTCANAAGAAIRLPQAYSLEKAMKMYARI